MNNNGFAMMRYLCDLGADAHLLLYANDGEGSLAHFKPICDTFYFEDWKSRIHKMPISNAPISGIGFPWDIFFYVYSIIRSLWGNHSGIACRATPKRLKTCFAGYDSIICSGIAPAVLNKLGIRADIFSPYASGIEFYNSLEDIALLKKSGIFKRWLLKKVYHKQGVGIKDARYVCTAEAGLTKKSLDKLGVKPLPLAMPIVYTNEIVPRKLQGIIFDQLLNAICSADLSIMMHSRLVWSDVDDLERVRSKNNHWVLYALKAIIDLRPNLCPLLIILEYGPHIQKTKTLATELGLNKYIFWLPKMPRKELLWILSKVQVGIGEFIQGDGTIWGGTGWEVLASGKPLLQGFNFEDDEFECMFGSPPPPLLPVTSKDDLLNHLLFAADFPDKVAEIGDQARQWFDNHNGNSLARHWLTLVMNSTTSAKLPVQL